MVIHPFVENLPTAPARSSSSFSAATSNQEPFLDAGPFLAHLPVGHAYAVEIRNPAVLGPRYRDILRTHGVAHTYTHWTGMPPLLMQHRLMGERFTAPFVMRLLTPLGLRHASAVERFAPYNRIVTLSPHAPRPSP